MLYALITVNIDYTKHKGNSKMAKHQHHSGHASCAPIMVKSAFDCVHSVKIGLRKQEIVKSMAAIGGRKGFEVPDMPDVVVRLEKEIRQRYPNSKKIVEIIESNAVIAGELLSIVKSPVYQRHVKRAIEVKTIAHVVSFIGMQQAYRLAMAAAIKSIPAKSSLYRSIIDHSADVALACAEIAGYIHDIEIEDAYLFGLFRDGGAIGLSGKLDTAYEPYWNRMLSFPETGVIMEYEQLNVRHDYLGIMAARHWGFGDGEGELDMLLAIQEHHNYREVRCFENERVRLLVAIGLLAETLVNTINGENYQATEVNEIQAIAVDTLCMPESVLKLVRSNLLSTLISRT
jgi:HD-like signal output (HDOD) protein